MYMSRTLICVVHDSLGPWCIHSAGWVFRFELHTVLLPYQCRGREELIPGDCGLDQDMNGLNITIKSKVNLHEENIVSWDRGNSAHPSVARFLSSTHSTNWIAKTDQLTGFIVDTFVIIVVEPLYPFSHLADSPGI